MIKNPALVASSPKNSETDGAEPHYYVEVFNSAALHWMCISKQLPSLPAAIALAELLVNLPGCVCIEATIWVEHDKEKRFCDRIRPKAPPEPIDAAEASSNE